MSSSFVRHRGEWPDAAPPLRRAYSLPTYRYLDDVWLEWQPRKSSDSCSYLYKVVVNYEEQYSIWPADRENPLGWTEAGKTDNKAECLAYIQEVWTDMRPLSLRKRMAESP